MKSYIGFMMALSGVVAADSVNVSHNSRSVVIKFDEPVVPLSVVENSYNDKATPQERGLELFDLTGCESQYLPEARWLDQDRLQLTYRKGFEGNTVFRVAFKPGAAQYLSGNKMPQPVFEFSYQARPLSSTHVNEGLPREGVCLYVQEPLTKAQLAFSHADAVTYEFREVVNERQLRGTGKRYGRTVAGDARPAQVKHLPAQRAFSILWAGRKVEDIKKEEMAAMTPDTVLPGYVLVEPVAELPAGHDWELVVAPAEGTDLCDNVYSVNAAEPLRMAVSDVVTSKGEKAAHELQLSFNAPVLKSEAVDIFRRIELNVGEAKAVNSEDGRSKTITLPDGRTLEFSLKEFEREYQSRMAYMKHNSEARKSYSYNPPYTQQLLLSVKGTAALPQVLDVTMPAGLRAMLGAESKEAQRMRISLTPGVPRLDAQRGITQPALLPDSGEHKLHVGAYNLSKLQVSAARLTPEQFLEYVDMLQQVSFGQVPELAAAQYNLARLKTCRGIAGMEVSSNEIRIAERRVKNLLKNVPDTAALRSRLKGVEFSPALELPVEASGAAGLLSTDVAINLDTVTGGRALPGFYLLSVRREPVAEVQEQLRRVGVDPACYTSEEWYSVLLTNLNVICGADAVVATRLSDGAPVQQARLLQKNKEPIAMQYGVGVVPSERNTRNRNRWLVMQSGEDYFPVNWIDRGVRLDDDCRMELVRDRGTYRPGEQVHLRGVLRHVSPAGKASIPAVRSVELSVNRPNGTRLLEKKLPVNEYGAFEYEFTLPEGDEDVTGDYRVLAFCDDFRAYDYVPCQVFRRDAFEVKSELTLQPVRPSEYKVKVSATDLNGSPLSGARVKLYTHVNQSATVPRNAAPQQPQQLTLGADGTAEYSASLPDLQPDQVYNSVSISGVVSNDREEVLRLPGQSCSFYPADFTAELRDSHVIVLHQVVGQGEQSRVLNRAQTVHLRLLSYLPHEEELPNGVVIEDSRRLPLWEGDVTVPADAVKGVPTDLLERWKKFADSLNKSERHANPPMVVEMTATDHAGRKIAQTLQNYTPSIHENRMFGYRRMGERTSAELEGDTLRVKAPLSRAGEAVVVVRSVLGTRALPCVAVQEGMNEFTLPLAAGEVGNVQVCLLLPVQKDGLFYKLESSAAYVKVPDKAAALKTELQLPQQAVRPGERITLGGKVLGPDGKPAMAQVTLFAVDAGMLSVDRYNPPNILSRFTTVWVDDFNPRMASLDLGTVYPGPRGWSLLPGIWNGDWLDKDGRVVKRLFNAHYHDDGMVTYAAKGVMRMNKRAAAPVAAMGGDEIAIAEEGAVERDMAIEQAEHMSMDMAPPVSNKMVATMGAAESQVAAPAAPMPMAAPRLRTHFVPVAVWCAALNTDDNGCFTTEAVMPDTLTTYKVFALVLGKDGKSFGNAEGEFKVNQPVMLTPGTPLFMSMGDTLRLPLTITNNTDAEGSWTVTLEGAAAPQQVTLHAGATTTLYFDYTAAEEGERRLHWQAVAAVGSDAVEGGFDVRFPAPVLKEAHHLVMNEGQEALKVATLLAPELAGSARGELQVLMSANPLLHLYGCMELVQNNAYPCTQYGATSMMVWMLYDRLAPFSPIMAQTPAAEARKMVTNGISELLKCQQEDGGISFWCGARKSSPWTSAYVGLVLTLAQEQGFEVNAAAMKKLQSYLRQQLKLSRQPKPEVTFSPFDLYAIGRTIADRKTADEALALALKSAEKNSAEAAIFAPVLQGGCWWRTGHAVASLRFLAEMSRDKMDIHADFLKWMRAVGHDYRHATQWDGGWMLIALHEYLRRTPGSNAEATVALQDGQQLTLGQGMTTITPAVTPILADSPATLAPVTGTTYVTVKAKALPEQTEYPGVTEKGLQVTRIYEKRGDDGVWREAREFNVGDVVRVTLTCAKGDRELEYFVLEDYLPSCMEAINPEVPSQAAGLEWRPWSHWFDRKEYLSYRVRGFCTRWGGRDLLNMSYYARVKRAGVTTAPPAQAQLMYEPQTYGLSSNAVITSK
ncbi:MAG: hypothetical protein IKZ13_08975 [Akkermansia sp.]|nr:hypothetical protein [Akkermansia sp.]